MAEVRVTEKSSIKHAVLIMLFFLAVLNHVVRSLSSSTRGGIPTLTEWDPSSVAGLIGSVNVVRVGMGNKVSHLSTYCPTSVADGCVGVTTAINFVLGLNP